MACTDSFTSGLLVYIDFLHQPMVCQLSSYIRDSSHVNEILKEYSWQEGYTWTSLDVTSLYTSIPHEVGLAAIKYFFTKNGEMNSIQSKFILDSIEFCLRHNYFTFLDQFYLQTNGTAMGANFAPVYANLTMGYWEEGHVWANKPFAKHIVFYRRYIDDILLKWSGGLDVFTSFVAHCNANNLGLSFTHVLDPNELVFLDLVLFHDQQAILTRNHTKPTSGNSYFHFDSCHHSI